MIVSQFTILRFFEMFPKCLLSVRPVGRAETAPVNNYPADFEIISERLRTRRGWTCESCDGSFAALSDRKFLHVHHKRKNNSSNLNPPRIVPRLPCQGTAACAHETTSRVPRFRAQIRCLTILKDGPQVAGLESPSYWGCGCPEWRPCCEILKLP